MDVLVIGGGPGGYVAAIRAAQLGASVTLIEKEHLGGTCLNIGCIPTKALLHTASLAEEIRNRGRELGLITKEVAIDFPQVMAHKDEVAKRLSGGVAGLLKKNKVTVVRGTACLTGDKKVQVYAGDGGTKTFTPDAVIIATGSCNAIPPIKGLQDNPYCIDSTGALSLEEVPKTMVVVGGGVIGSELACAYAAFGTKVTIVEALDHILPMLDVEVTAIGMQHMEKMGIKVMLASPVTSVEAADGKAIVHCNREDGSEISFEGEKVLVAVGRKANTESLGLDAAGIKHDRGRILVNEKMETNVPGIYAIGDCVFGQAQLAHAASAMGEVAAENIMGGASVYDPKTCPNCVYIEPEAASVGLTEAACKEQGIAYNVGKFPMFANGKAIILNGGEGIVKIIAGVEYGEILGMHIIGPRASDLITEGALAIGDEMTLDEIISTIHSHPTITEALREAALQAEGRPIHI